MEKEGLFFNMNAPYEENIIYRDFIDFLEGRIISGGTQIGPAISLKDLLEGSQLCIYSKRDHKELLEIALEYYDAVEGDSTGLEEFNPRYIIFTRNLVTYESQICQRTDINYMDILYLCNYISKTFARSR